MKVQSTPRTPAQVPRERCRRSYVNKVRYSISITSHSPSSNKPPIKSFTSPSCTSLLRDIKLYQDTIATFGIPSLYERFEFIRQLGNVFLVRPEILKSYIAEGYLGRIDSSLLRPYLAQRSDWGQAEKGFNDSVGAEDGTSESKALKDRFGMGRLSMIMKDLEPLNHMSMPSMPVSIPSMPLSMPSLPAGFSTFSSISSRGLGSTASGAPLPPPPTTTAN